VKQSEGHIFCYSEPGKGTTFSIYLPRVPGGCQPHETDAAANPRAAEGRETILLVEDDATVRAFTRSLLSAHGYTVVEAAGGAEALEKMRAARGSIDLLITDVVMPRMSGLELARTVRGSTPDLKVLFVSGYAETVFAEEGAFGPLPAFVQKPFSTADFLFKVRQILDSDPASPRHGLPQD